MEDSEITFRYDPISEEPLEPAGAQQGWIVWRSEDGGSFAAKAVQLTDGEGGGSIVQTAPPEPVIITER